MTSHPPSLLESLSESDQRFLREHCTRHRYQAGAYVFHAGEAGDSLHIIEKGKVIVLAGGLLGEPFALEIFQAGDVFGELAVLGREPVRAATIQAIEPTETLVLRRAQLNELRESRAGIDGFVVVLLADKVSHLTAQITEIIEVPATVRIYRQLVRLAQIFGANADGRVIPLTQREIASLAGVRLRFANQVIAAAKRHHLVDTRRGKVIVVDWSGLVSRAGRAGV